VTAFIFPTPSFRLALALALAVSIPAAGQDAGPQADQKPASGPTISPLRAVGPLVPLDVQVVVSRYQGEKKISSLPYAMAVNANDRDTSSIRMGAEVPVVSNPIASGGPKPPSMVNYKAIGTNIDCFARTMEDGRFQVNITVEDAWVYENSTSTVSPSLAGQPVMRSFKSTNTLVMRDGQTRQFTTATDRVNGEVVRIEVTVRVVK
jgi:hypothetical protein